jgi:CzcA family heavy metal efflux pump
MLNAVIRWALRNRTLVLALAAGILVWGAYTAQRAPVEVFPRFATPRVTVQTEAPGFPPRQVEQQVTYPLEDALLGLQGVQLVRSHSIAGLSVIKMIFQAHTNLWVDRELVSQALAAAPRLPPGVGPARLTPATSAIGLIAVLGLTSSQPMTLAREFQMRSYAQWVLRRRLLALPGVADVTVFGGEPKQYEVVVSPARLRQYHLTLAQVVRAAGASNAQGAGGFFQTPDQDLVIHASGLVTALAQLRRSVVTMRHGAPVTLGDIATVRYGAPPPIGGATVNGNPGVILQVFTQPGAGTVPVTRRVDAALAGLRRNLPAGMRLEPDLFRQATFIRASIGDLRVAMWEGGLLVILVLLLFLRSWRASLISILAIPLSLFLAIIILVSFGATLNTMTLGGLVLALGEVVDDAIIDVENISRRMRETRRAAEGEGRKAGLLELVYRASVEVRGSVVHATLAVALVFVPIFFLGGLEGRIFTPLGEAYILSTLSSLLVALTVTPVLAYWLLPGDGNIAAGRQTAFAHWLQTGYERIVAATLGHPRLIGAASLAAAAAGLALVPFMGGAFLPAFNQDSLIAHMASLSGTSLRANLRAGAAFERQLLRLPNIASADQRDGRSQLGEDTTAVNYSEFDIRFKPTTRKTLAQQEAEVRRVTERFPAFAWSVDESISERINEVLGGDTAAVAVKIFGPKEAMLARFAARARNLMAGVRGAAGVSVEQQVDAPQVNIAFDRRAAQAYGVTSGRVAMAVQTALVGDSVGRVFQGQEIFPLVVKLPRRLHGELARIRSIPVAAPSGAGSTPIPLAAVARVRLTRGLAIIQHQNGVRMVAVQSDVAGRPAVNFVQAVERRLNAGLHLPPGYYYSIGGQFASRARAIRRLEWLGLFALIGILFLLQYAFRNWRDAWLVIVNVPLAFIGGILAVELSGSAVSVATLAGFITLFGITLRNGIMLVSHYQHLEREEGEAFGPALVIRGARERLLPILMTALAYGLALLPIVLESGRPGGALEQPMAVVILGGLATSTILNLLVVPALYLRYARPVHAPAT